MHLERSGRPHSARRSQPLALTPEGEVSLALDGVIFSKRADEGKPYRQTLSQLRGRDGLDFRDPTYLQEA